jgi:F-type H+-transporting ATPase subunit h
MEYRQSITSNPSPLPLRFIHPCPRSYKLTLKFVLYTADFVQDLYLKELKAYKAPAVQESDSVGQVQTFNLPKTPKSPEETDLASSLKEYESMAVEVEGQDASGSGATPVAEDWLVEEEEEAHGHH